MSGRRGWTAGEREESTSRPPGRGKDEQTATPGTCRMWLGLGLGCQRAHTESKQGNQVSKQGK